MRKRILALFLAVALCCLAAGCASAPVVAPLGKQKTTLPTETTQTATAPAQTDPTEDAESPSEGITPLLYKVTDSDGDVVWLFGAIHLGREEYYPLPEYVMAAYADSDALAVELDVVAFERNISAQMQAMRKLLYTDGTKISDHIPQRLYNDAVKILEEHKLYNEAMDAYLPAMWFMLVDNAIFMDTGLDGELGVDRYFIKQAKKDGKKIREIESAEFQYTMLAEFSEPLQTMLLQSSVVSSQVPMISKKQMEQLEDSWSAGDEEMLKMLFREEQSALIPPEQAKLLAEYNEAMYTNRNDAMTDYAENALQTGEELFICVGAAHIVGDGAMADQLKERGYAVETVSYG